jgi:hypothetical protein
MSANERQIGGSHYKVEPGKEEHWDRVHRLGLDYFQGQITKYVERWKLKNGLQDLHKARHFLDKYIEVEEKRALGIATGSMVIPPVVSDPLNPTRLRDCRCECHLGVDIQHVSPCCDGMRVEEEGGPTRGYVDQG